MANGFALGGFAEGAAGVRAERRAGRALAQQDRGLELEAERNEIQRLDLKAKRRAELFARDKDAKQRGIEHVKSYRLARRTAFNGFKTTATNMRNSGATIEDINRFAAATFKSLSKAQETADSVVSGLTANGVQVAGFVPLAEEIQAFVNTLPDDAELDRRGALTAAREGRGTGTAALAAEPGESAAIAAGAEIAGEAAATTALAQADTLAAEQDISREEALATAGIKSADVPTTVRVVGGDTLQGQRLGIEPGKFARVQFDLGPNGQTTNPSVLGGIGGGDTSISVDLGSSLNKELGILGAAQVETVIETGELANRVEGAYLQAAELLASGVKTGRAQPILLFFNSFARDLGADLSAVGKRLGIDVGSPNAVVQQENFRRVTTELVIEGFQKFRGNLNQKEVEIAENAFAKLGDDEESNIDAIAAGLAAIQLAKERAATAQDAIFSDDPVTASKEALKARFSDKNGKKFLALKAQKAEEIRSALVSNQTSATRSQLLFNFSTPADIANGDFAEVEAFADQLLLPNAPKVSQEMKNAIFARLKAGG